MKFRYVVSGSDSGLVYIWNTDTGKSLAPLEGHKCAAALGSRSRLPSGDRGLRPPPS